MAKGKTKNLSSRNVVKYLWLYLNNKKYSNVLDWTNKENKEFFVFFMHKKNPMWSPQYLNLFKAMDAISYSKQGKYAQRPNYETECKKRFHSNMQKLCKDGILKDMGRKQIGSSSSKYFYKFLEIPSYDAKTDNEMLKKANGRAKRIEVNDCAQAPYKNRLSHYLCLSIEELNKHLLEKTCKVDTFIETSRDTLPRKEVSTDLNAVLQPLKINDWEGKTPVEFPSRRETSTDLNAVGLSSKRNDWEGETLVEFIPSRREASTVLNAALQFLKNDWKEKTPVEFFPSRKEASTDLNGQCSNLNNENDWMGKWTEMDTFKNVMFPARETCQDFNQDVNQIGNETFSFDLQDVEDNIVTDMLNFLSGIEDSLNLNK